ncbi:complement C2-like isoform X2 [Mycteria americana]|uniref:complement C2-like isoform X2 n=1 Tax=Mycteria americana TaxID=33587 RepID=UPI003F5870B5
MLPALLALLLLAGGARPGPAPTACPPAGPRCPPGTYPHPPPRHRPGRCPPPGNETPVVCREVRCPAPLSFPHGTVSPRRPSHAPGAVLAFACEEGLVLRGPERLRCRRGGLWSGASPVCDDGAGDCPPAPVPAGGVTTGRSRRRGAEVHVRCGAGLTLLGPAHRRCLETGRWSGPEPSCRHPYAYDLPEDVSEGFGASLTSVLELAGARSLNGSSLGRRIVLSAGGSLRLYLLLDASGSVRSENFRLFQECGTAIVDRLSSFEMAVSFAVISFASQARVIVSTSEDEAADADEVLRRLENMTFAEGAGGADGPPRGLAGRPPRRHPADGRQVQRRGAPAGRSGQDRGRAGDQAGPGGLPGHLRLRGGDAGGGRGGAGGRGLAPAGRDPRLQAGGRGRPAEGAGSGAGGHHPRGPLRCHRPRRSPPAPLARRPEGEGKLVPLRRWVLHEGFDVRAGVSRGIPEFYDYDVALVELEEDLGTRGTPRRVCIPCTEDANRAMRKPAGTSCEEQEAELLGRPRVPAEFVSLDPQRMRVQLKSQEAWAACASGATQPGTPYAGAALGDVVTERFLCSGQEAGGPPEAATCKGDSGGSLFLERRHRFIQVGVVSWGTFDPCRGGRRAAGGLLLRPPAPPGHRPRDFHISLFRVQPWLRRLLGGVLAFAPLR